MTSAITVFITSLLLIGADGPRPVLLRWGSDPARGLLVNRTPGTRPFDPPDPSRATVVFIQGINPAPRLVHFEMATRLAESLAKRRTVCNVLEWDWNAATCDSLRPRVNSINSVEQGRLLANGLTKAGINPTRTHLIGHSAGAMVAASAANVFAVGWGRPIAQLTMLDPATFYHAVIFQQLQAGSLAPLVENYWTESPSAFGNEARLPGVRDYHVTGQSYYYGMIRPLRSDHVSIVSWYLGTIEHPGTTIGFNTNQWIDNP